MAKIRGGSTIGGRQIASVDMIQDVIHQIKNETNEEIFSRIDEKLDLTGGTITGNLQVNGETTINNQLVLQVPNTNYKLTAKVEDVNKAYAVILNTNLGSIQSNKDIFINGSRVYHQGNLNLDSFMSSEMKTTTTTDLNLLLDSGVYTGTFTNCPIVSRCIVEVNSNRNKSEIIQKVYSFDGKTYYRVYINAVWRSWNTIGSTTTYSKNITTSDWSNGTDAKELTVTHSLNSENITSVVVTDSNQVSMFTGFKVIDANRITIYCSSATSGKVVVNAVR